MKEVTVGNHDVAFVDDADYLSIKQFHWWANKRQHTTYARAYIYDGDSWRFAYMHGFLMRPPKGLVVDHVNRNGLDNQRENLRNVTVSENALNSVRSTDRDGIFVGVHWYKQKRRWRVMVGNRYVGLFDSQQDAVLARDNFIAASFVAS